MDLIDPSQTYIYTTLSKCVLRALRAANGVANSPFPFRPIQLEPPAFDSMAHRHQRMPIVRLGLHNVTLNMLNCQKTHRMLSYARPAFAFAAVLSSAQQFLACSHYRTIVWERIRSALCSISVCVKSSTVSRVANGRCPTPERTGPRTLWD